MYTDCLCHRLYLHTSSLSDQSTPICYSPDHSTQTLYHFLCLGSAGGYSNYFWTDSRKPAGKSSDCEHFAATILQFESKDQFRKVIIISFCFRFRLVWLGRPGDKNVGDKRRPRRIATGGLEVAEPESSIKPVLSCLVY